MEIINEPYLNHPEIVVNWYESKVEITEKEKEYPRA
jgi:hypothetical protein